MHEDAERGGGEETRCTPVMLPAHQDVVHAVAARCREGGQRMTEISDALLVVTDTYDGEEGKNDHLIRGLY